MQLELFALPDNVAELMNALPDMFDRWDKELEKAKPIFDFDDKTIDEVCRSIPQHQSYYARLSQEARALVKWLELTKERSEARYLKNYHAAPRTLTAKEQSIYLQGEKDIYELKQLIVEAQYKQGLFEQVVDAVKQMGWMVGHIVKVRVAEVDDAL